MNDVRDYGWSFRHRAIHISGLESSATDHGAAKEAVVDDAGEVAGDAWAGGAEAGRTTQLEAAAGRRATAGETRRRRHGATWWVGLTCSDTA